MSTAMMNCHCLYQQQGVLVLQTLTEFTGASDLYGSFNLGLHVQDDPTRVLSNRNQLLAAINQFLVRTPEALAAAANESNAIKRIYWLNQVHGNQLINIDEQPLQLLAPTADAMSSCQIGMALAIMTADCVPIVLHQPSTGRIAAIHAGWQGLANGVIDRTLRQFFPASAEPTHNRHKMHGDTHRADVCDAWIGACIGVDSYEVSTEVLNRLLIACQCYMSLPVDELSAQISRPVEYSANNLTDHLTNNSDNEPDKYSAKQSDKVLLNLPQLARLQLQQYPVNVHTQTPPCSYRGSQYYSYRRQTHRQQAATGRMAMLIMRYQ